MKTATDQGYDRSAFKQTLVGYIVICAASSGFYQQLFWGAGAPLLFWACIASAGALFIAGKEIKCYRTDRKTSILRDLMFILPVILIPMLPLRKDIALAAMLLYGVGNLLLYIYGYFSKRESDGSSV